MTPWWSFNGLKHRLGRFQFLIIIVVMLTTSTYLGFQIGGEVQSWQETKLDEQQIRLFNLYDELDRKTRQINYLSVELEVEQNANTQIQQELKELRDESFSLRRELNFYQKVLAPELVADGIAVEQFDVEPTNIEGRYKFRFALVQTDNKKRYAKGYVRLKLIGSKDDEKISWDLAKLSGLPLSKLKFSFHYFQYFEGEFELEKGAIAEELEVKVIQPKSKWQRYKSFTQSLEWPDFTPLSTD